MQATFRGRKHQTTQHLGVGSIPVVINLILPYKLGNVGV
jgi:hypothetical protein